MMSTQFICVLSADITTTCIQHDAAVFHNAGPSVPELNYINAMAEVAAR